MKAFYIGIFGLAGVFSRYYIAEFVGLKWAPSFPYAVFAINISGAFMIGVFYVLGAEQAVLPPDLRTGILVGFLGGYTTFSTYCMDAARLFEAKEFAAGLTYFLLSPALGLMACYAGLALTRLLVRG